MRDRARDYLQDLREHWDDHYWRADHPELELGAALIAGVLFAMVRLTFTTLELLVRRRLA